MTDAYAELSGILHPGRRPSGFALGGWLLGDVLAAGHGALQVVCNGLTLGQEDLHVPKGLDYAWTEDTGGDGLLRAGDRLIVLVSADGQDYYVLQKAGG